MNSRMTSWALFFNLGGMSPFTLTTEEIANILLFSISCATLISVYVCR